METRANYVLIGAFALAGFIGMLGFFLWFAQVQLDRQFAYYDVRFDSVSGLARASDVRFAGLPVGTVVDVSLSPDDGRVVVRLEVAADVPVRTSSVATIESQGVTGISFVGISAGDARDPLLVDTTDGVPEIESGRSVLQSLTEDAPEIVSEALQVMRQLSDIFSAENQQRITNILDNLERSSGDLGGALEAFAEITGTVGDASAEIAAFTGELEPLITPFANALGTLDTVLVEVGELASRIGRTLDVGDEVLVAAQSALQTIDRVGQDEIPPAMAELRDTATSLRTQLDSLGADAQGLIAQFTATGAAATARLTDAETTLARANELIARLDTTLATVDRTAAAAEALIAGEGTELAAAATQLMDSDVPRALSDLRAAAASARITSDDLGNLITLEAPRLFDDLRATSTTVRSEIGTLGTDARGLMATFAATGTEATLRLAEAEATIAAVNAALGRVDGTLAAVERSAEAVEQITTGDATALVAEARAMVTTVNRIAETDLPAIIADVRAATGTAARVVEQVGADLTTAAGRVEALSDTTTAAVAEAGETIARARTTLDTLDAALATGTRTLDAAERTFTTADRVMNEDIDAITTDLRAMIAQLEATFATVAEDFPAITADLRRASASADDAFAELEAMARDARGPVGDFATGALPQFSQLAREARSLVASFDRLVRALERDPSRVLFSRPTTPEFRR